MTNSEEKREMIFEAMGLIEAAKELLDEAVRGTEIESNYLAYGRYGIDTLLGNGNPYDDGIHTIMESIESIEPDVEFDWMMPSPDCSSNPCDNCREHGPNGEKCRTLDYCPDFEIEEFLVTKKFYSGCFEGLTTMVKTTVEMKVGLIVMNPVAGSPYKVISCEPIL